MSSPQEHPLGRKPKSDNYEYSWFLPAGANNGSASVSHLPPSEQDPAEGNGENSGQTAMEARTEKWRHSGKTTHRSSMPFSLHMDPQILGLVGIAGWSAIAAAGGLVLASRAGPFPGLQLGILGVTWIGISVLIWFLPRKL